MRQLMLSLVHCARWRPGEQHFSGPLVVVSLISFEPMEAKRIMSVPGVSFPAVKSDATPLGMAQHEPVDIASTNPDGVVVLSGVTAEIVKLFSVPSGEAGPLTHFHSSAMPTVSIEAYCERLNKYLTPTWPAWIYAMVYVDRIVNRERSLRCNLCLHRLVLTALVIAIKILRDTPRDNSVSARVGGVHTQDLNVMELEMLFGLAFDLTVDQAQVEELYYKFSRNA